MTSENKENSVYHSQLRTPATAKYSKFTPFSNTEAKFTNAPRSSKQSTPRWFQNPLFNENTPHNQAQNGPSQSIGRLSEQQVKSEQQIRSEQVQGFSFAVDSPASSVPTPDFGSHVENKYRSIFSAPSKGDNMKSFNNVLLEQQRIDEGQDICMQNSEQQERRNNSQQQMGRESEHGFVERLIYSVPTMKRFDEDIGYSSQKGLLPLFENQNQDESDDKLMDTIDNQYSASNYCEGSPLSDGQNIRRSQRVKTRENQKVVIQMKESGDSNLDEYMQSPRRSPRLKNKHFVAISVMEKY
eukprot:TRINITY_DN940_c0_g1_i11.p2 TRINITY_DN940_c0_g1~~TRINITY_DN940_c0_g1_i11.p2  ORF type:complete len:323 (-),score=32.90 TRINITY_DN940_c0_g1_i11:731-1624(-)